MHIKGCENSTKWNTREEEEAYREGYERIFGKKEVQNVGGQTYDEDTGRWVSNEDYLRTHPIKRGKRPVFRQKYFTRVTKPNGDWTKGQMTGYIKEDLPMTRYY